MLLLGSMLQSILFGHCCRALQAEICGCERCCCPALGILGCLWHDGRVVEDCAKAHLVMANASVHELLTLGQEPLYVFCEPSESGHGRAWPSKPRGSDDIPQPYIGTPGTGGLTLFTFLGEAGVVGRAAMLPFYLVCYPKRVCWRGIRLSASWPKAGSVSRARRGCRQRFQEQKSSCNERCRWEQLSEVW